MAHVVADRVLETSTSTGTGAITLGGALTGFRTFASVAASSDTLFYFVEGVDANGLPSGEWETGLGTLGSGTLTRTAVIASSNAGALVAFSAGTKYVGIGPLAARTLGLTPELACVLPAAASEPPAPPADTLAFYAKTLLPGHTALKVKRPSGVDAPLQDALAFNRFQKWQGTNTAMVATGAAALTAGTAGTAVTMASGSAKAHQLGMLFSTAGTAGALNTLRAPTAHTAPVFRGGVAGEGGFRLVLRFALNAMQAGNRGFWGLAASTAAATNIDPHTTAAPARVGLSFNANTGNWFINASNGTTAAATDLGATLPLDTTSLIELVLFCRPFTTTAGDIAYRVRRFTTSSDSHVAEVSGTLTANLPGGTTLLHPWQFITNNATAAVCSWNFGNLTLESDW